MKTELKVYMYGISNKSAIFSKVKEAIILEIKNIFTRINLVAEGIKQRLKTLPKNPERNKSTLEDGDEKLFKN